MGKVVAFRSLRGARRQTVDGEAIVELRRAWNWSQEALARELNCSVSAVQKWESTSRTPTGIYLDRLLILIAEQQSLRNLRRA